MKKSNETYYGERPLFNSNDLELSNVTFEEGESPLKESNNITLTSSTFKWKYPLWYCNNVIVKNCILEEMARAGMWYSNDIKFIDTVIIAPKAFRKSHNIYLENIDFHQAKETLWNCSDITMKNVKAKGDYFALNCQNIVIDDLNLIGDYAFDGASNLTIKNSNLHTKDAFWNSKDVVITDSYIKGEYFGWNSKNITLINCTVESLQGFCYIENLVLINCTLINTTLAFEYSNVVASLNGKVDSIKNPYSAEILVDEMGEVILDSTKVDPTKTKITHKTKKEELRILKSSNCVAI